MKYRLNICIEETFCFTRTKSWWKLNISNDIILQCYHSTTPIRKIALTDMQCQKRLKHFEQKIALMTMQNIEKNQKTMKRIFLRAERCCLEKRVKNITKIVETIFVDTTNSVPTRCYDENDDHKRTRQIYAFEYASKKNDKISERNKKRAQIEIVSWFTTQKTRSKCHESCD